MRKLMYALVILFTLSISLYSCREETTAGKVGDSVEDVADDVADDVEDAADDVEDALD